MAHGTIPDPTDSGNKPGTGPLRAGGEPVKALDKNDADRPDTLSPQAQAQVKATTIMRDLWGGTETVRARGSVYLPRAPGEDPNDYNSRLRRSPFFNAVRRTVEGLTGLVFRKDPVLGEDVPSPIHEHWENIDMAGTHGDVFARERCEDVLQVGHGAILVEFPQTDGEQTAAEEMSEIRPYWVPILKEDILSWRIENVKGRTVLLQVVLRERGYRDVGKFGSEAFTQYRVIMLDSIDGKPVVTWALMEVADDNVVSITDTGTYTNQIEIPLAELITSGRKSIFESDPPLLDLGYLNVAHYQMWSDYSTAIHKTNVPIFVVTGLENANDGKAEPLVLGPNTYLDIPNPDGDAKYVSHDGAALDSTKKALDDLKADMGTLGLAMLAPQKRSAETAEAKRLDKSTSDSALSVTARGLQDGFENALKFHARYLPGSPEGGSIEVNRDFEGLLMDAPVMTAFGTLVNAGFPPRPVLEALQRGGRIRPDEDLVALEMEWIAGAAAKEKQDELDMEAQTGDAV